MRIRIKPLKFTFFLVIVFSIIFSIKSLVETYLFIKENKKKIMNSIMSNIDIRKKGFYEDTPEDKINVSVLTKNKEIRKNKEKEVKTKNKYYYIQIGMYKNKENANKIMAKAAKFHPKIMTKKIKDKIFYKVIIDNIKNLKTANELIKKIYKACKMDKMPFIRVVYDKWKK